MIINNAVENRTPTTIARAIKRLKEITPEKNKNTRTAKTNVSKNADNTIPFFLFMIRCSAIVIEMLFLI
jgi:hypothetical protein